MRALFALALMQVEPLFALALALFALALLFGWLAFRESGAGTLEHPAQNARRRARQAQLVGCG